MKKRVLSLFVVLFAIITLISCGSKEASSISLKGYTSSYTVGDTFNTNGLVVTAQKGDESINVTDEVVIDSSAVDMSKPGTYAVIVKYGSISEAYYVTVAEVPNEQRLLSLEVDTTNVKLSYMVGEIFSSEGLGLIATYQNSNGDPNEVKYITDLSDFEVVIRDSSNLNVEGAFTSVGEYTVYITQGTVRASFVVSVTKGAASIADAVSTAVANRYSVAGGSTTSKNPNSNAYYANVTANYEYGDNLTSITYEYNGDSYTENYFIGSEGNVIGIRVNEDFVALDPTDPKYDPNDKAMTILDGITNDYANGVEYSVFAGRQYYISAESMLEGLYNLAKTNPNYDYSESITVSTTDTGDNTYLYSFSFGYLEEAQTASVFFLHKVAVNFTLGNRNILDNLEVKCDTYMVSDLLNDFTITPKGEPTNMLFYKDGATFPTLTDGYTIGDCMARLKTTATPNTHYSCSHSITQYAGARDAANKYPEEEIYVTSYDIVNSDNEILTDLTFNTTIDDNNNSDSAINLKMINFNNDNARKLDVIDFIYNGKDYGNFIYEDEVILYYSLSENTLRIRCFKYGTYTFELKTAKTTKTLVVNCDWRNPVTFTTQIFQDNANPELASFINSKTASCFINDVIYFRALPDATGDPEFIPTCASSNVSLVIPTDNLPEALLTTTDLFYAFSASEAGTYVITLKSTRNNVSCQLTVTVQEEPDFTEALSGTYSFEYLENLSSKGTGSITFSLDESSEGLSGTATVKIGEYEEVISFYYANREFSNVGHIDGDNGNVKLSLNADLEIVISCNYGSGKYVAQNGILTR